MSCCQDKMEPVGTDSCCTPSETSQDAALTMHKTGCGCVPVVEDKESRRLVGVVTERDLCQHVTAENRRPSEVPVEKIMRAASACCGVSELPRRSPAHTRRASGNESARCGRGGLLPRNNQFPPSPGNVRPQITGALGEAMCAPRSEDQTPGGDCVFRLAIGR
jgi:hypothetical protein